MIGHYNELLRAAADDGGSATLGLSRNHSAEELDELMEAWYRERQECIETGFFLDAARDLLKRIITEQRITPASRRKVANLLIAIEAINRGA